MMDIRNNKANLVSRVSSSTYGERLDSMQHVDATILNTSYLAIIIANGSCSTWIVIIAFQTNRLLSTQPMFFVYL